MQEFFDWVADNAWAAWFSGAALLGVAEMLSLDLVLLMLATGAVAGGIGALAGLGVVVSVLIATIVSVGMLALVRPSVVKRLHRGAEYADGAAALTGRHGVVTAAIGPRAQGLIQMDGDEWTARSYDENIEIGPGTRVQVFEIDGATAVVYPDE